MRHPVLPAVAPDGAARRREVLVVHDGHGHQAAQAEQVLLADDGAEVQGVRNPAVEREMALLEGEVGVLPLQRAGPVEGVVEGRLDAVPVGDDRLDPVLLARAVIPRPGLAEDPSGGRLRWNR